MVMLHLYEFKNKRTMKNIVIISGHTDLKESFANKTILEEMTRLLPQADYAYLDSLYPDFQIDVPTEQERLLKADIIVFQFPLFWYSAPSLLNRWIEQTFVHGFSHGSTGDKLRGKKLLLSFTSGAPEEMYQYGGLQNYPIDDFMPSFKQMCNLCGLEWCGYIYTGGLSYAMRHDPEKLENMRIKSLEHAQRLNARLNEIIEL